VALIYLPAMLLGWETPGDTSSVHVLAVSWKYCCMKQTEKCCGRGFDSPRLHQKEIRMEKYTQREWDRLVGIGSVPLEYSQSPSDGADLVSTGQPLSEQTTRESTDVISEKP